MAAAESIYSLPLQNPYLVVSLAETVKGVADPVIQNLPSGKVGKKLLTTQPPVLVPKAPEEPNFLDKLYAYMIEIMKTLVALTADNAKADQYQTAQSNASVQISQEILDDTKKNMETYEAAVKKAQEQEKHRSFWQKLAAYVGGGLMILGGLLTGNIACVAMGAIFIAMTATNANDQFSKVLADHIHSAALRTVVDVGIVVAASVILCGACGALQAAFTDAAAEAGEAETGQAINAATKAAASSADADAENGAAQAADAGSGANKAATNQSFGSKVYNMGFSGGKTLTMATQMTLFVNPFTDLMLTVLNWTHTGDEKKKEVANITGTILAVLANIAAAFREAGAVGKAERTLQNAKNTGDTTQILKAEKNLQDIRQGTQPIFSKLSQYGDDQFDKVAFGVKTALYTACSIFRVMSAVYAIKESETLHQEGDLTKEIGNTRAAQQTIQAVTDMSNLLIEQNQHAFQAMDNVYAMITKRWDAYVEMYRMAQEVMG